MKTRQAGKIRLEAFSRCLKCELRNYCNTFCEKEEICYIFTNR